MAPTPANLTFTGKQTELLEAILTGGYKFALYGGAIRGGKTYGALAIIILLATRYPRSRWAIVRKDTPTLKRNILPTFNKLREESGAKHFVSDMNNQTSIAKCANGSELVFFTEQIERDPELNRWRGLEVNGFFLDEANELSEKTLEKAMERLGSWIVPKEERPPSLILMTANPCRNWLKEEIYDKWKSGKLKHPWLYIPATPVDNPHLPEDYRQTLLELKDKNPISFARFVEGDWDVSDGDIFKRSMFNGHDGADEREHTLGFFADIAYTRKKTSDYCAMGLAGIDKIGTKRWFNTCIERMDTDESSTYIIDRAREYNSRDLNVKFWIEANDAYIALLKQTAKIKGVKFQIEQLKTGGQAKADRIMASKIGLNLWEFDTGSQQLINQFLDWSPALEGTVPDDGPDMHAYADVKLKWDSNQVSTWDKWKNPPTDEMALKVWKSMKKKHRTSKREPVSF